MDYLYNKMRKKIDEILSKEERMDIHSLAKTLPNKIRFTRLDVYKMIDEMDKKGLICRKGNLVFNKKRR